MPVQAAQQLELSAFDSDLSEATSFEDLARLTVQACANAAHAEICTLWRVYHDEEGSSRLRLAAAHGVEARERLASEITYAITPPRKRHHFTGRDRTVFHFDSSPEPISRLSPGLNQTTQPSACRRTSPAAQGTAQRASDACRGRGCNQCAGRSPN